jgi:proline iminopeptidase
VRRLPKTPTVPRSEGHVQGAGARIWYETIGRGLPVLLLHGGPGADHTDFLPYLRPLARHCRLVLIDQRGSGHSERLADKTRYHLDYMVEDLEALRRNLKIKQWVVLGHSFGGILAQAYAVRHPRRLAGLVLAGTASSAKSVDSDFRKILRGARATQRARLRALERAGIFKPSGEYTPAYAALSARVLSAYMHAKPPPARARDAPPIATEVVREMWSARSYFRIHGNLKGFDFTRRLRALDAPVLIVIGDRDIVTPASAELTRRACRRATLVVMAECAHMMFVDQTQQFNELLLSFIRGCARECRLKSP